MYVVVVIRYFSDEIKYAIVFVFFNSISIKFLFPKAHWVRAYRQLFLAGDVVILPSLTVGKQKNGCKASEMVWSYIGELIFNMLVLVGAVKMSDRVVRGMMGL